MSATTFLHLFKNMAETDQMRSLARDHAAYRWAPRPSAQWTPEQQDAYNQEYEVARGLPGNTSFYILVTPSKFVKRAPYFHSVSGRTYEIAQNILDGLQKQEAAKGNSMMSSTFQILDYKEARQAAQRLGISL